MNLSLLTGLQKLFYSNLSILKKLREINPEEIPSLNSEELLNFGIRGKEAELIISKEVIKIGEDELNKAEKAGVLIIPIFSEDFPSLLKEIDYPPLVIYLKGKKEVLKKPCISIVGTRKCTSYGRVVADSISSELSNRGIVIVSGLARGIDSVVHSSAVENGETIAVLGTGIDKIYPRENRKIAEKIEENGAIISEFPLGASALPFHFPLRNRIISGLSYITVVVEASERSGSLITSKWALEQGRDVLAVPGNITSSSSKGANLLIKQGAKPVLSWKDIFEELPLFLRDTLRKEKREMPKLSEIEERILSFIPSDSEITIDELSLYSELPVYELFHVLFELQIKGFVIENPGKSYQRKLI
ncbi:MAG: DNA-processing protein DprA [Candidatus Aminicenantia bacterium]